MKNKNKTIIKKKVQVNPNSDIDETIGKYQNENITTLSKSLVYNIILLISLLSLVPFIIINILELGISIKFKICLILSFLIPAFVFIYFIVFKKLDVIDKSSAIQEAIYKRRTNNFTILISLFIFYATFFIGLLIFKERIPEGKIPFLKDGSFGMRSWQSRVIVKKIKIHYLDPYGNWCLIPKNIIYDKNNWTETSWNHEKLKSQITTLKNLSNWNLNKYRKHISIGDTVSSNIDSSGFVIQNCALIFTPHLSFQQVFHDIRIDCEVLFEKINEPVSELYPGFQLISFIDTSKVVNEKGVKNFSELCLQFNLGMNNNHMPWIPALDYEPSTIFTPSINKMSEFGNYSNMKLKKVYSISSIIYRNKVLFLGHTNGTVKLFEAELTNE